MKEKKKLDELTKCKLFYSGELIIIAIIAIVLGALFLASIIKVADWKKWLFTLLTLVGGLWAIYEFVWTLKSEKKRKRSCLLDKILLLPNGVFLIGLDIYALVRLAQDKAWTGDRGFNYFAAVIGGALIYLGAVYIFEGIYHWFKIHPLVYEMMEEDKEKEEPKEDIKLENDTKENKDQ